LAEIFRVKNRKGEVMACRAYQKGVCTRGKHGKLPTGADSLQELSEEVNRAAVGTKAYFLPSAVLMEIALSLGDLKKRVLANGGGRSGEQQVSFSSTSVSTSSSSSCSSGFEKTVGGGSSNVGKRGNSRDGGDRQGSPRQGKGIAQPQQSSADAYAAAYERHQRQTQGYSLGSVQSQSQSESQGFVDCRPARTSEGQQQMMWDDRIEGNKALAAYQEASKQFVESNNNNSGEKAMMIQSIHAFGQAYFGNRGGREVGASAAEEGEGAAGATAIETAMRGVAGAFSVPASMSSADTSYFSDRRRGPYDQELVLGQGQGQGYGGEREDEDCDWRRARLHDHDRDRDYQLGLEEVHLKEEPIAAVKEERH
jgi:hypothetical protein